MPDSTEGHRGDYCLETGRALTSLSQGSAAAAREAAEYDVLPCALKGYVSSQ